MLRALREERVTLSRASAGIALYPQVLVNVLVSHAENLTRHAAVCKAVQAAERDLGASGRVLLRASGTEPVIRVMVEGKARASVKRWADSIAGVVRTAAGANSG